MTDVSDWGTPRRAPRRRNDRYIGPWDTCTGPEASKRPIYVTVARLHRSRAPARALGAAGRPPQRRPPAPLSGAVEIASNGMR